MQPDRRALPEGQAAEPLEGGQAPAGALRPGPGQGGGAEGGSAPPRTRYVAPSRTAADAAAFRHCQPRRADHAARLPASHAKAARWRRDRSEEHTSELQSLMRISYAVF